MHHDEAYFAEPKRFLPERHLTTTTSTTTTTNVTQNQNQNLNQNNNNQEHQHGIKHGKYPRNAHRPFERGLRSCMGQNLAMDELKMALLFLGRWFDFDLDLPVSEHKHKGDSSYKEDSSFAKGDDFEEHRSEKSRPDDHDDDDLKKKKDTDEMEKKKKRKSVDMKNADIKHRMGHTDLDLVLGAHAFAVQRFTVGVREGCEVGVSLADR